MPQELPADYYLANFRQLLDFVAKRYWPLLNEQEQAFYRRFTCAPRAAQMLYVRLLSRRGEHFLRRKLAYPEIGSIDAAADSLVANRLLETDPALDLDQVCALLTKQDICQQLGLSRSLSRPELLRQAASDLRGQPAVIARLMAGQVVYRLLDADLFTTFKLCFFGNLRQDLTDFVLRDLGLFRYEDYPLEQRQLLFSCRSQIELHLRYYRCSEQLDAALPGDPETIEALWQALPPRQPGDPVLDRRLQRLGHTLARQLERLGATQRALEIYRQLEQPPARERSARILASNGDLSGSLQLCEEMLAAPANDEEHHFAAEFGYRQSRKHGLQWPRPVRYQPPQQQLVLEPAGARVELAAAHYLAVEGDCHFVENSLLNGVLGLLIWDIIFAPVRGAFFNPFQSAPSDFYDPGFVSRRGPLLQRRFREIARPGAMARIVLASYEDKFGISNPLVNWPALSETLLRQALERIPLDHWRSMLQRLLGDLRQHRSGMPDLVYFPGTGGYEWIEVKGPGDRLQKNQQRWLAFFAAQSIPHRVLHVAWLTT